MNSNDLSWSMIRWLGQRAQYGMDFWLARKFSIFGLVSSFLQSAVACGTRASKSSSLSRYWDNSLIARTLKSPTQIFPSHKVSRTLKFCKIFWILTNSAENMLWNICIDLYIRRTFGCKLRFSYRSFQNNNSDVFSLWI